MARSLVERLGDDVVLTARQARAVAAVMRAVEGISRPVVPG